MFAPRDAVRSPTLASSCAIKCNALNLPFLEDGVKRRKPAPSTVAVGWGLDCLPATGRSPVLLRWLTQP